MLHLFWKLAKNFAIAVDEFSLAVPLYCTLFPLLYTDQILCDFLCCIGRHAPGRQLLMNIDVSPSRGRLENVVRHFSQQACSENNHFNAHISAFTIAPRGQVYSFWQPPPGVILFNTGLISKILFSIIYLDPKTWKNGA